MMETDEMTTGRASLAKAVAGATAAPPGTTLLEAYRKWQASQAAAGTLGKVADQAAELEAKALKKSRKRLAKHLREGMAPTVACDRAHEHYRLNGGKSGFTVWARRVAEGR